MNLNKCYTLHRVTYSLWWSIWTVVTSCSTYNSHTSSSFPEQGIRIQLHFLSLLSVLSLLSTLSLLQILCLSDPLRLTIFALQGRNLSVSAYQIHDVSTIVNTFMYIILQWFEVGQYFIGLWWQQQNCWLWHVQRKHFRRCHSWDFLWHSRLHCPWGN